MIPILNSNNNSPAIHTISIPVVTAGGFIGELYMAFLGNFPLNIN
jgi:hypothetical protein